LAASLPGDQEQAQPKGFHRVPAAGDQAGGGAAGLEEQVLVGDGDDLSRVELADEGGGEQELLHAGGRAVLVRPAGSQDRAAAQVGDEPRGGRH
jgi:hypothetical protein